MMKQSTLTRLDMAIKELTIVAENIRIEGTEIVGSHDHLAIIRHYDALRSATSRIKEGNKALSEIEDSFSRDFVPEALREQGVTNLTIEGVGRVTISHRFSCSIPDKPKGYAWLRENGHGGLITETVNSSSLSAFARDLVEEQGKELPADIFKTSTMAFTSITKAK